MRVNKKMAMITTNYFDYLPEEIIEYINKIVFTDTLDKVKTFVPLSEYCRTFMGRWRDDCRCWLNRMDKINQDDNWLKSLPYDADFEYHTLTELKIPMTDLFPYGFGKGKFQKDNVSREGRAFTNGINAINEPNKEAQIKSYTAIVINGKVFKLRLGYSRLGQWVDWSRGTIGEGDLFYEFENKQLGKVRMTNAHKIRKSTKTVEFTLNIKGTWRYENSFASAEAKSAWKQFIYSLDNIEDVLLQGVVGEVVEA